MSTRAIIKVEGVDHAALYKHCDGYPDATLKWLEDFNCDFKENRGDDSIYKLAQLIRSTVRDADKYDLANDKYIGWGIVEYDQDWGQEFEYLLNNDGSVIVTEV